MRKKRWQKDFFRERGLLVEEDGFTVSFQNSLNLQAMRCRPLPPLRKDLLGQLFDRHYLTWINRNARARRPMDVIHEWLSKFSIGRWMDHRLIDYQDHRRLAYNAYLTLKPLQNIMEKRDAARKEI
jgi:hypothetical protein